MISNSLSSLAATTQINANASAANLARTSVYNRTAKMSDAQAEKTSKDFESMFVSQMLEQMFGDSIGTELFGDEETSEVYKGLMMNEYGKEIAKAGGIGIADYVKRELLKAQEV